MEMNITEMWNAFESCMDDTHNYQDSVANSGMDNIGEITWNNAKCSPYQLVTDENRQEIIDFLDDYGAWDDLHEWDTPTLNALMVQFVTSWIDERHDFESWNDYDADENVCHILYESNGEVFASIAH